MKIGVSIVKWGRLHPGCVNGKKKWLLCRETGRVACIEFLSLRWKFLRSVPIFISFDIFYLFTVSCLDFSPNFEHFGREKNRNKSLCMNRRRNSLLGCNLTHYLAYMVLCMVSHLVYLFFFQISKSSFYTSFFLYIMKKKIFFIILFQNNSKNKYSL